MYVEEQKKMAEVIGRMKTHPEYQTGFLSGIFTLVEDNTRTQIFAPAIEEAKDGDIFVEVGVFLGGNICRVADMIKNSGKDINLYGVDDFSFHNISYMAKDVSGLTAIGEDVNYFEECMRNIKNTESDVNIINSDSIEASKKFEDESITFLYLDGDHNRDYVSKELDIWIDKVKTGGTIAGHDFYDKGIQAEVFERFGKENVTFNLDQHASYAVKKK